jgi:hypothetical protein
VLGKGKSVFPVTNTLAYYKKDIIYPKQRIIIVASGLYYKRVTIVIDPPSVIKVTLQIVASFTIIIDNARLRLS